MCTILRVNCIESILYWECTLLRVQCIEITLCWEYIILKIHYIESALCWEYTWPSLAVASIWLRSIWRFQSLFAASLIRRLSITILGWGVSLAFSSTGWYEDINPACIHMCWIHMSIRKLRYNSPSRDEISSHEWVSTRWTLVHVLLAHTVPPVYHTCDPYTWAT